MLGQNSVFQCKRQVCDVTSWLLKHPNENKNKEFSRMFNGLDKPFRVKVFIMDGTAHFADQTTKSPKVLTTHF